MRVRELVAATVLAAGLGGVLAIGLASPAFADPGTTEGKDLVKCVNKALSDNAAQIKKSQFTDFKTALDDCRKAKSLLTPPLSEIIWGGVAFAIVVVALIKFAFPPLKNALKARADKIRSDLEGAEKAREEAEAERTRYQAQLNEARGEATRIVEEARQAAERVRADVVGRAETEAQEVRARADDDIRLARERAVTDLQHQMANLSIELAEKIVERNLDRDTQMALVENYISSVGGNGQN
jgi:F-type H+-transporting ATPase subunit b